VFEPAHKSQIKNSKAVRVFDTRQARAIFGNPKGDRLLLVTFLGKTRKVTGCWATRASGQQACETTNWIASLRSQ
jgi:hypothetical protein